MDYILGSIVLFPYTFTPYGWMPCNGQTLQVSQYSALYSLIGGIYGGSGSTFNLPNLQGAEPLPQMKYYICIQGIYPQRD